MKIGCCIDLSHYDTLAALGYETIALAAKDVAAWDEQAFEAAKGKLQAGPLQTVSLNSFCTPALRLNGAGYDPKKLEAYMQALSARANGLGYRYIGIGRATCRRGRTAAVRWMRCGKRSKFSATQPRRMALKC